jgi:hypothetical protein
MKQSIEGEAPEKHEGGNLGLERGVEESNLNYGRVFGRDLQ